jgi:hypothetical protein
MDTKAGSMELEQEGAVRLVKPHRRILKGSDARQLCLLSAGKTCITLLVGVIMIVMTVNMETLRHCLENTTAMFAHAGDGDWSATSQIVAFFTDNDSTVTAAPLPPPHHFFTRPTIPAGPSAPLPTTRAPTPTTLPPAGPRTSSRTAKRIVYHCLLTDISSDKMLRLCPFTRGNLNTGKVGWTVAFLHIDERSGDGVHSALASSSPSPHHRRQLVSLAAPVFASLGSSAEYLAFFHWMQACRRKEPPRLATPPCTALLSPLPASGAIHTPDCPYRSEIKTFGSFVYCLGFEREADHLQLNTVSLSRTETDRVFLALNHYYPAVLSSSEP